jgi:hypothetical protein
MSRRIWGLLCAATAAVIASSAAASASFIASPGGSPIFAAPVRVQAATGFTEPRIVTAPDGTLVAIVNGGSVTPAHVAMRHPGRQWTSSSPFPGQQVQTADLDVAVTGSGRIVATELDAAGFGARIAYTDDFGAHWTPSVTASDVDVDRPWLGAGPGRHIFLLFHNLLTGLATQNMFVETSSDDGATFGPPVPVTVPGTQAFLDLQCADASGPSSIVVDQRTGRLSVSWATRTSTAGGGCGASVVPGPVQVSLVASTRIWVATSADATAGSWSSTLAVDDSRTGQIVAMQFAPLALDAAGTLYLVSQESPNVYPDYNGAALQYRWSGDSGASWSPPKTIVAAGGAGTVIPEVVAGSPGRLSIAYLAGVVSAAADPTWIPTVAVIGDATSAHATVDIAPITTLSTAKMTASRMMGAGPGCGSGPAGGVLNGFGLVCSKAQDDFGITRAGACGVAVVWSADTSTDHPGDYVSEQLAGPGLCASAASGVPATGGAAIAAGAHTALPATGGSRGLPWVGGAALVVALMGIAASRSRTDRGRSR